MFWWQRSSLLLISYVVLLKESHHPTISCIQMFCIWLLYLRAARKGQIQIHNTVKMNLAICTLTNLVNKNIFFCPTVSHTCFTRFFPKKKAHLTSPKSTHQLCPADCSFNEWTPLLTYQLFLVFLWNQALDESNIKTSKKNSKFY